MESWNLLKSEKGVLANLYTAFSPLYRIEVLTGFGIAGMYMGYQLGFDAVEYARTITKNQDVLAYVVNQHPTITKLVTIVGVGGVMAEVGKLGGLVDLVLGTYTKD